MIFSTTKKLKCYILQIVDPDLKILNINARYPGARNDAYIWSTSPMRHVMEHCYNRGERRTYLIGKNKIYNIYKIFIFMIKYVIYT